MRCLALLLAAAALALGPASRACAALFISVDKSAQQMTVSVDGETRYVWPVSTGRRGYDTPNGEFTALGMDRYHFSREWDDAPMPHTVFFTKKGHAIHGTFEQRNLGRAASHGCVRLSLKNAATLFALVKEQGKANTTVLLTGAIPARAAPLVVQRVTGVRQAAVNGDDDEAPPPTRYGYRERPRTFYDRERSYYPMRRYYRMGGFPFFGR
jgi:hypothetical protein